MFQPRNTGLLLLRPNEQHDMTTSGTKQRLEMILLPCFCSGGDRAATSGAGMRRQHSSAIMLHLCTRRGACEPMHEKLFSERLVSYKRLAS